MTRSTDPGAVLDAVLDSLASLVGGEDKRRYNVWPKARAEAFDGFEVFDPVLHRDDFVLRSDPGDAPVWPMDARWAFRVFAADNEMGLADGWLFKRVNTLRPADWRGRLSRVFPRMVEHHELHVPASGDAVGSSGPLAVSGGRVFDVGVRNHARAGLDRVDTRSMYGASPAGGVDAAVEAFDVGLAHGVELRREYLWSVLLGEEGIPRARFVTDPLGVREAFRLRDIPPGRARRDALRHWVREHWRKRGREGAGDRAWVRAHLRGATEFGWSGLCCRIEPSREDARASVRSPGGAS